MAVRSSDSAKRNAATTYYHENPMESFASSRLQQIRFRDKPSRDPLKKYLGCFNLKDAEGEPRLFGKLNFVTNVGETPTQKIQDILNQKQTPQSGCFEGGITWVKCDGAIKTEIKQIIDREINSTAFYLRILSGSFMNVPEIVDNPLQFQETPIPKYDPYVVFSITDFSKLNGFWANDSQYIKISLAKSDTNTKKLIMAFGPSASGKSTIGANFISAFDELPKSYMTIDGGRYRELSVTYQTIVKALGERGLAFSNMHDELFKAGKIKEEIIKYLTNSEQKFNLYVPDTITKCLTLVLRTTCQSLYQSYITITEDTDWIGLHIWQHIHGADCPYDAEHKCEGCYESGKKREQIEGKQYDSRSYSLADKYGRNEAARAPGGGFIIHNCGASDRKSIVEKANSLGVANGEFSKRTKLPIMNFSTCGLNQPPLKNGGRITRRTKKYKKKTMRHKRKYNV